MATPLPQFEELRGAVVFVTGGHQGIGAAIRDTFVAEGATVVSADLAYDNTELVREAAGFWSIRLDVSAEDEVVRALAAVADQLGAARILVNAAGISTMDFVVDSATSDWERNASINAEGAYLVAKHFAQGLLGAGSQGKIVFIASQAGKNGYRGMAAYVASKHAVLGLTKTLGIELASAGINVNAVCPGIIETAMKHRERIEGAQLRGLTPADIEAEDNSQVPLGRTGQPQDVANVVLFLSSHLSDYMTGQGINVTGGMTMN